MTRILIIEDEGSYREALTFMLGKEGFFLAASLMRMMARAAAIELSVLFIRPP